MRQTERPEEAPEITPQVLHLRDLLKWVRQGRVRVPKFQRDFTWDRGRMLGLFDSVRKQYPIGSLLFWESSKVREMSDRLGPLRVPGFAGGKLMIQDGQQRLTTLAGVLLFDELKAVPTDDKDPDRWLMYYDAASDEFTYLDEPQPPPSAVRVSELMGTKGLYDAAQRIMTMPEAAADRDTREGWVERIQAVSSALAAYRVPLVIFATESIRLVVESFTRLNRKGQKIGADEMFSALTYAEDELGGETFRLAAQIDSILKEVAQTGFGEVDRVVVLRSVLLAAELDPFRTEWDQLAEETQKKASAKLLGAIAEAQRGLLSAVAFLRTENIPNSRLLPYSMQLVGLAAFFGSCKDATAAQIALLRRWLWVTSFTQTFGGLNPSRILVQLKNLREVISKDPNPSIVEGIDLDDAARPFPQRYDQRSARVRALLCVMLREKVLAPDGSSISPDEMAKKVLALGPEAFARVCGKMPVDKGTPPLAPSPANRVFDVTSQSRVQAKRWLLSLEPSNRREILESHYISEDAWTALSRNDHRAFVEERIKTLMAVERRFMKEKGVVPPKTDRPGPSAIDIEDDVPLSDDVDADVP